MESILQHMASGVETLANEWYRAGWAGLALSVLYGAALILCLRTFLRRLASFSELDRAKEVPCITVIVTAGIGILVFGIATLCTLEASIYRIVAPHASLLRELLKKGTWE